LPDTAKHVAKLAERSVRGAVRRGGSLFWREQMVYVGEGYEITSAGIRKIENYGMQPREDNPYVLFTHYEADELVRISNIANLNSIVEILKEEISKLELDK